MTTKPIRVIASLSFARDLKRLNKKYRHIEADVRPITDQLQAGDTPGDLISGVGLTIYKVRVPNRDIRRGKSGGYRIIYYLRSADFVFLIAIYSKSDRDDIRADELKRLVEEVSTDHPNENDDEQE